MFSSLLSEPVVIEAVFAQNYPEITEVWEASVRATHHFLSEADIQYFKPLILNDFLKMVDLVGIKNQKGDIIGFMGTHNDNLEMLFIHPQAIGKGLGKLFVDHAIKNLKVYKVDVNEQNLRQ
ncbi:MAG: GNAT family N-acetyltransferase [Spirosomataceae bacterium]